MADSKSAGRMWRDYFRTSNGDIFETIEKAIIVAASDYPKEFRFRRDGIAQTLFSCKLIRCSGCDKVELALPGDDDDDKGVKRKSESVNVDGNGSKGRDKEISSWRDDEDVHHRKELNVNNHQVSNYSYGVAEALSDEIEEETQMFGEVMRIKEIVDNSQDESESVLYNSVRKLQLMELSVEVLKATEIGKSVNALRKHASKDVSQIARTLIEAWKDMVDQWVIATEKTAAVPEATPESLNPSVLDEEEGLPSPPLDDLALYYPHTTSLELSEFFDGMDEYGNPGNSGGFNKNRDDGRREKQSESVPKWKQQKPSNEPTMVPRESDRAVKKQEGSTIMKKNQPTFAKPITPSVAESGPGRRIKPNTERKLQTVPKTPHQNNPRAASGDATPQDKFEAAKRKLQERYQQAENAKKQRTIQVMELHDLPKQHHGFPSRNQQSRPGNNHNRHHR